MSKHSRKPKILVAVAIACLLGGCASTTRQPQQEPATQSDATLPPGRLGYPLGKYLTIEGIRLERGKVGTSTLLVDKINGQAVSSPFGVRIHNIDALPKGVRCVLNGYESGRMIGVPREVLKKENLSTPQALWQFSRYFIATSVVEPKDLKIK